MKTTWSRVTGERDPWWQNVKRLLSGQGIRREPPEAAAVQATAEAFAEALKAQSIPKTQIGLSLSHEGQGEQRAVTVLAYSTDWETSSQADSAEGIEAVGGVRIRGEMPPGKPLRGEALRRLPQDGGLS